jgi:hypothetical protein
MDTGSAQKMRQPKFFYARTFSAAARRQAWQRQSSPSTGMGRRTVSSQHQQAPPGRHSKRVPQRAQAMSRITVVSGRGAVMRLIMKPC